MFPDGNPFQQNDSSEEESFDSSDSETIKKFKKQDLHMEVRDFLKLGEDLCRVMINFLPFPNYRKKVTFMIDKLILLLHEEMIKNLIIPHLANGAD